MKINVTTLDNTKGESITLNPEIFEIEPRKDILHRVVQWQLAKRQAGTHKTKVVGEVRLTGKKPFKQKGTGHARQGSLKGPHMVGGGIAHGPQPRSHAYSLPKNIRKLGLKAALSLKAKEGKLRIFDTLVVKEAKTSEMAKKLEALGISSALFVRGDNAKDEFFNSIQNIPHMDQIPVIGLNVYDILKHDEIAITTHALKALEERLA